MVPTWLCIPFRSVKDASLASAGYTRRSYGRSQPFPAETEQKWEYKALPCDCCRSTLSWLKDFPKFPGGPLSLSLSLSLSLFHSSFMSLSLLCPTTFVRSFSRSVPAFPLIFHRSRTGVAAAECPLTRGNPTMEHLHPPSFTPLPILIFIQPALSSYLRINKNVRGERKISFFASRTWLVR